MRNDLGSGIKGRKPRGFCVLLRSLAANSDVIMCLSRFDSKGEVDPPKGEHEQSLFSFPQNEGSIISDYKLTYTVMKTFAIHTT